MARSWAVWLVMAGAVAALAGCQSNPGLEVTVTHPANLSAMITDTKVTVYAATNLKCEDVEFGEVSEDTLSGAQVGEIDIDALAHETTGSLGGITRDDSKLVVARGYAGSGGALFAAGCAPVDDVTSAQQLAIATVPAATVNAAAADDTSDTLGRTVQVADPLGNPIDAREVTWTVFAPSGTTPAGPTMGSAGSDVWTASLKSCTDATGTVTIHPVPPLQVSGYEVQVHASWEASPVPLYSQTALAANTVTQLGNIPANPLLGPNVCAAFTTAAGATDLACVVASGSNVAIGDWALGKGAAGFTLKHSVVVPSDVVGVIAGSGAPFAVETSGKLLAIDFVGDTAVAAGSVCPSVGCALQAVAALPACGSAAASGSDAMPRVLAEVDAATGFAVGAFDAPAGTKLAGLDLTIKAGSAMPPAAVATLDAAGCVAVVDAAGVQSVHQSFVVDLFLIKLAKASVSRAFYTCADDPSGWCHVDLPFPGGGVGYSPPGPAPSLDGTAFAPEGADVLAWSLGTRLIQRASLPAASVPAQIVFGKFEANDATDAMWDITGKRGTLLEVSYAETVEGHPLAALGTLDQNITTLVTGDFDGDSYTDVAEVSELDIGASVSYSIAVLATGALAAPITVPTDPTCPGS